MLRATPVFRCVVAAFILCGLLSPLSSRAEDSAQPAAAISEPVVLASGPLEFVVRAASKALVISANLAKRTLIEFSRDVNVIADQWRKFADAEAQEDYENYKEWEQWEPTSTGGLLLKYAMEENYLFNMGGYLTVREPKRAWEYGKKGALFMGPVLAGILASAGGPGAAFLAAGETYEQIDSAADALEIMYYLGVDWDPLSDPKEKAEAELELGNKAKEWLAEKWFEPRFLKELKTDKARKILRKLHLRAEAAAKMLSKAAGKLFTEKAAEGAEGKGPGKSASGASRLIMQENPAVVGGVRAFYGRRVLQRTLMARAPGKAAHLLAALRKRLNQEKDPGRQEQILQEFVRELKVAIKASRGLSEIDQLAVVSLKALVTRAEKYAGHWEDLPQELRRPGKLARVRGFILDAGHGDVLILGSREPRAPGLEIDDLIVAVRAVWQEGGAPTCSLDPDPEHLASKRVGPQNVRLIDLPRDCGFARSLLDADYTMKKMLFGATPVRAAGFTSLEQLLRGASDAEVESLQSRFWFIPVPPDLGDVQVGADGRIALFQNKLEVLTEQVALSGEGQLAGTGMVNSAADRAAASLTRHWAAIAREEPHFQKLQLLTDLVLLSSLLREGRVNSPILNRLGRLPYRRVPVPDSYPGIKQAIGGDSARWLFGGVRLKAPIGQRSWLVLEDEDTKLLRKKALEVRFDHGIAVPLPGVRVHLPVASRLPARRRSNPSLALKKLTNREWKDALVEANRAVQDAPDEPLPRAVRALAHLALGNLRASQRDVLGAHWLSVGDLDLDALLISVLEYGLGVARESPIPAKPTSGALVGAHSKEAALLRGSVLFLLDQIPLARR
jgi:hypothetical protein